MGKKKKKADSLDKLFEKVAKMPEDEKNKALREMTTMIKKKTEALRQTREHREKQVKCNSPVDDMLRQQMNI